MLNKKDNPLYFENQLINTNYVKCVPDYTIINVCGLNVLCIGGAISVDRSYRIHCNSVRIVNYMKYHNCDYKTAEQECPLVYWENEPIVYKPKVNKHIDIICSHSAPSFCCPTTKGPIVDEYIKYDKELLNDLDKERHTLDLVYEDYKDQITHWYYGHFHADNIEIINNIKFKLLGIGSVCRHEFTSDNNNIL